MFFKRKGQLCFGLLLVLFITFLVSFVDYSDVNAASTWVNNPTFNYWTITQNTELMGPTRYQTTDTPPFNILAKPSGGINYLVGMTVNGIDVSSYSYDDYTIFYMDFQLRVVNGSSNYTYFPNVPPFTKFVVDNYSNSCDIESSSNQLYYQYHCAVSLPENYTPHYLYLDIGEPYSSGPPFSPVAQLRSSLSGSPVITFNYLGYGFDTQQSQTSQYLDILSSQQQTIINQNQTIINQNQTIINQNAEYYEHEYDAIDNIENQTPNDMNVGTGNYTNLIGLLQGFLVMLQTPRSLNCELTLPFPEYAGGTVVVNPCSFKEKAPAIVQWGSSLLLVTFFIPFAFIMLKMIYNEIRSWTNG